MLIRGNWIEGVHQRELDRGCSSKGKRYNREQDRGCSLNAWIEGILIQRELDRGCSWNIENVHQLELEGTK